MMKPPNCKHNLKSCATGLPLCAALYRQILGVSLPLVISTATVMAMEFTDRVFLAHYSLEAIAAVTPGGIAAWLFIAFFVGLAEYVNVFVAQYVGARRPRQVGQAIWQGIYFTAFATLCLIGIAAVGAPLFGWIGHGDRIRELETIYFQILCLGAPIHILGLVFSCFYSGRGVTLPVMSIYLAGLILNVPLNYCMINGIAFFPEMGIAGAGLATVGAWLFMTVLFGLCLFTRGNERQFAIWSGRRFNADLLKRLFRFGGPGAVQFCLDIFGFTFFVMMVGRLGDFYLAVTNIVFSINSLAFMPMMGFSLGVSTLVGQALGDGRQQAAADAVRGTRHLICVYLVAMLVVFLGLPEIMLALFQPENMPTAEFENLLHTGTILLRFVAAYIFLDAHYMVYTGALKGAGDTRFIMWSVCGATLFVMILPLCLIVHLGGGIYPVWSCVLAYVFSLYALSYYRFRHGNWKTMRVI
jgi:MATE family multidrug resistance protein